MPALVNHVRSLPSAGRRGITLIELLVVMVILSIVTAASIPLLTTGVEQRRVRESARLVASYISSAKSRAIETGRPAGVMIQRYLPASVTNTSGVIQTLPDYAFSLVTVEVPPPYSGDTTSSMAIVSSQFLGQEIIALNDDSVRILRQRQIWNHQLWRRDEPGMGRYPALRACQGLW